jgi:hypothetical protein
MGFPDQEPRASGGYTDDETIPDNGRYLDDLSSLDYSGSAGDLSDRYEDTVDEDAVDEDTVDEDTVDEDYDEDDYDDDDDDDDESDDLGILGDDELYDEGADYDPSGFPRPAGGDNGQAGGSRPGMTG